MFSTGAELADPGGQEMFDELMEAKREFCGRWRAGDESSNLKEFDRNQAPTILSDPLSK